MAAQKKKPTRAASVPDPSSPPTVTLGDLADDVGRTMNVDDEQPSNDIFAQDAIRHKKYVDAGVDTEVAEISLVRRDENGQDSIPGRYPIELMNLAEILKRWGPGIYEIRGFNAERKAIAYARHTLKHPRGYVAPRPGPPPAAVAASTHDDGESLERQLMRAVLMKMVNGSGGGSDDGMRGAMSDMMKMMTMQMQLSLTGLQAQQTIASQANAPGKEMQDRFLSLVEKTIGAKGNGGGGGFTEALPILQLGMSLGQRMAGNGAAIVPAGDDPNKPPGWLEVVPEIADTVGVPLIVSLAQAFLPADKAKQVMEAIGEHARARQAEAKAQGGGAAGGDEGSPHVDLG